MNETGRNRTDGPGPIVEIRNISKSYRRGNQAIPVLEDITLEIPRGEFLALMGPSGSGKSTLLNLIAGLSGVVCPVLLETRLHDCIQRHPCVCYGSVQD